MNFKQKSKTSILNLNNASIFIYRGHPLHYASYLLLLSLFIYSFLSRVFITYRDFTTLSLIFTRGFTQLLQGYEGQQVFPPGKVLLP
jgi:hypothetical protein